MIDLNAAIASLNAILSLLKNAKDAQLAMSISREVANLQGKLIDVQQQAIGIQDENQRLRDEIRALKHAAEDEESFQFLPGVYWKTFDALSSRLDEDGKMRMETGSERYTGRVRSAQDAGMRMRKRCV